MAHTTHDERATPTPRGRGRVMIVSLAALSTVVAFAITVVQRRALGDEPLAMLGVGCVIAGVGGFMRLGRPLRVGLAAMAGFPVTAIVDLFLNGGHSLLPIEFAFYAVYGGLGVFVAWIVRGRRG